MVLGRPETVLGTYRSIFYEASDWILTSLVYVAYLNPVGKVILLSDDGMPCP